MKIANYLKSSPVFALNATYEQIIPKVNKLLKSEKVNFLQGLVLTSLFFENDKEITPSELSHILQTSRSNISHIISALEADGLVKRRLSSKDARAFTIELKADGRKKAITLIKIFDKIQDAFEKELSLQSCRQLNDSLTLLKKAKLQ